LRGRRFHLMVSDRDMTSLGAHTQTKPRWECIHGGRVGALVCTNVSKSTAVSCIARNPYMGLIRFTYIDWIIKHTASKYPAAGLWPGPFEVVLAGGVFL